MIVESATAEQLVRSTDPDTSLAAAIRVAKSSRKAEAVAAVMSDGVVRIDEEIWQACRKRGFISTLATVQHGRLALSRAGFLHDTGVRVTTSNGSPSRGWRYDFTRGSVVVR